MDTTDPSIEFDASGVCNHCRAFEARVNGVWFPSEEGSRRLCGILDQIRSRGRGKPFDCALGLSGGADSCYVALLAAEWGLRPLVVHIDTGWNSDTSVSNVERLVKHCGFELHTHVVDWEEMKDLQLAYLRAGVPNQDVPQDHAIFAGLYRFCVRNGVKTILSGGNIATEGIFPESWHANAMDSVNLRAIHRAHGSRPLRYFPLISLWKLYALYPGVLRMRTIRPLNYLPYDRDRAIQQLQTACDWKPYGRKHGESKFTRLFQNHYLPTRFGLDKRKPHLSSMVVSGLITRERALELLQEPLYDPCELEQDIDYLCNKLGISRADYNELIAAPKRHHSEYPTWDRGYRTLKQMQRALRRLTGRDYRVYS
jgi:N-acetyl sugar amidotransferase